jgi:hypothetical protein
MFGYVYLTTNKINNKKYIGLSTKYLDEYLGSGVILIKAIEKYGSNNFNKIILQECNSKEELNNAEIYFIKLYDAVNDENFYNISGGGTGGNLGEKVNKRISDSVKGEKNGMYGKKHKKESMIKRTENIIKKYGGSPLKGIPRTKEDIIKITENTKLAMQNVDLKKHLSEKMKEFHKNTSNEIKEKINIKRINTLNAFYNTEEGAKLKKLKSKKSTGKLNHFYGKKHKRFVCPHCNKEGANGAMQRWHFDNCKQK